MLNRVLQGWPSVSFAVQSELSTDNLPKGKYSLALTHMNPGVI